jgi:hypothetical protein
MAAVQLRGDSYRLVFQYLGQQHSCMLGEITQAEAASLTRRVVNYPVAAPTWRTLLVRNFALSLLDRIIYSPEQFPDLGQVAIA